MYDVDYANAADAYNLFQMYINIIFGHLVIYVIFQIWTWDVWPPGE